MYHEEVGFGRQREEEGCVVYRARERRLGVRRRRYAYVRMGRGKTVNRNRRGRWQNGNYLDLSIQLGEIIRGLVYTSIRALLYHVHTRHEQHTFSWAEDESSKSGII
jgi:hypothetical protein